MEASFSAVSTPIFVSKYSFFQVFRVPQRIHTLAPNSKFADFPMLSLNLGEFSKFKLKIFVQIQYHIGVSLGSFIKRAITVRKSWMGDVCARGRPCSPPDHWSRNLFVHPPSEAEFPAEVAAKFDEGQPWFGVVDDIMFN